MYNCCFIFFNATFLFSTSLGLYFANPDNILGSFLIGLAVQLLAMRYSLSHEWQGFLIIGVLGGFTTFSAFSMEVGLMIEKGQLSTAAFYAFGSLFVGLAALFVGIYAGRSLL